MCSREMCISTDKRLSINIAYSHSVGIIAVYLVIVYHSDEKI